MYGREENGMKRVKRFIAATAAFALAVCSTGLISACGDGDHVHDYAWTVTKEPTCTEAGSRTGVCNNSGCPEKEVTESVPALGHAFGSWVETKIANCTQGGEEERTCTRTGCGFVEKNETPALGHAWGEGVPVKGKEPSCTQEGLMHYECDYCTETRDTTVEALGHLWRVIEETKAPTCTVAGVGKMQCERCGETREDGEIAPLGHDWKVTSTPATCTQPGTRTRTCTRTGCGETETSEIAPLGHNWETYFTVDRAATFTSEGERSHHCVRCDARDNIETIPKLDKNTEIEYEFRLLRNSGEAVNQSDITISVLDESGTEVARSRRSSLNGGVFKARLLPAKYMAVIDKTTLPAGYSAEEKYEVSYEDPVCKLWLTAAPISGEAGTGVKYKVGSVLHDFQYTTVDGKQLRLSELLEDYKLIVLNFFYTGCTWCNTEFPGLSKAYNTYKDDVCVIAIDPDPMGGDSAANIAVFKESHHYSFEFVRDTANGLAARFGVNSYPQTAFIDREGVVADYHVGAIGTDETTSERLFTQYFESYISDSGWRAASPAAAYARFDLDLPASRKQTPAS